MIIYKYQIDASFHNQATDLRLPVGAKLLNIGVQDSSLSAWFQIPNPESQKESRTFYCMHTGQDFNNDNLKFRQTIKMSNSYVVHVYEKMPFLDEKEFTI